MGKNVTQIWNNNNVNASAKIQEKKMFQKGYTWNPAKCAFENGTYFHSIINNSIKCDETIGMTEKNKKVLWQKIFIQKVFPQI